MNYEFKNQLARKQNYQTQSEIESESRIFENLCAATATGLALKYGLYHGMIALIICTPLVMLVKALDINDINDSNDMTYDRYNSLVYNASYEQCFDDFTTYDVTHILYFSC